MVANIARITGLGYALPAKIRTNDDPIFDWLKKNNPNGENLFKGYVQRHVLNEEESLQAIMLPAAIDAMAQAGVVPQDIDVLIGTASISEYINPNGLSALHRDLKLPQHTWVIPLNCEFSNFNASLMIAHHLIMGGAAKKILVCIGGNWTKNVDYHTPQAISAADGAAAVLISMSDDENCWSFFDHCTITDTQYYGSMYTGNKSVPLTPPQQGYASLLAPHAFQITEEGIQGFKDFGVNVTPQAALALLKKHGLSGKDITLISHQASSVLMNHWQTVIEPAHYINTIQEFANMAPANIPVNLAWSHKGQHIFTNYVLLLAIGPDMHANAVLLKRK